MNSKSSNIVSLPVQKTYVREDGNWTYHGFPWEKLNRDERTKAIQDGVKLKMTSAQIAELLQARHQDGGWSRNAIIGFARRRGIPLFYTGGGQVGRRRSLSKKQNVAQHVQARPRALVKEQSEDRALQAIVEHRQIAQTESMKYWNKQPIDPTAECVEPGCTGHPVLKKRYCREHCNRYYVIPIGRPRLRAPRFA